jgi:hypothetical protein
VILLLPLLLLLLLHATHLDNSLWPAAAHLQPAATAHTYTALT